ncbi:MAG: hypothetical protein PHR75_03330 [Sulfurovum sp.]|nr:hypothetical protein [Sulfurovum sp.]MDD3602491.1 hypothetical protein [Sulfurovum sp.]
MARPKKDNPRTKRITVWATNEEAALMETKARSTGVALSTYLRNLGCAYPIKSRADQYLISSLIQAKAELGRQGGLLKLFIVNTERKQSLGSRSVNDIDHLLDDMEQKQNRLLDIAEQILKG